VDGVWSLMLLLVARIYARGAGAVGGRAVLVLSLVIVWALRLSIYITWRNWGHAATRGIRRRLVERHGTAVDVGVVDGGVRREAL
jgi:steroid 5-alpha reductase family enzyme